MLIFGHRGARSTEAPENTLAAIERALRQGADGVEVDLRLTADGVVVCLHDPTLLRMTGNARDVTAVRFRDLPTVDGHPLPRMAEVLDLVGNRGHVVLELKNPPWPGSATSGLVPAVLAGLRRQRGSAITVSSFDRPRILELRTRSTGIRTALLGRPGLSLAVLLRRAVTDGHSEVHPHVSSVLPRPSEVGLAAAQGVTVIAWTVNQPQDLIALQAAGVHGVICDDPGAARRGLALQRLVSA